MEGKKVHFMTYKVKMGKLEAPEFEGAGEISVLETLGKGRRGRGLSEGRF